MANQQGAVFLSYASQDAEAARRICEALRAANIEVWFDQSELRGGDVWDTAIRNQIRDCTLFIPVLSLQTHARTEGYFRLEWKLAIDRSHLMAPDRAFLVPVVIDDTNKTDLRVPERFREVQWTQVPGGRASAGFIERISRLLAAHEAPAPTATGVLAPGTLAAQKPGRSWRLPAVVLLIAAIAVGYLLIDKFVLPKRDVAFGSSPMPPTPPSTLAADAVSEKSIAVLPFLDMSEKKDQEYFSDGLSEELIDLLTQAADLRVIARTSSFYFKGKQVTIAQIAKTLGVAYVLEGSVRKAGDTIRVTTQLARADSDLQVWSQSYDRDAKDIFKVQDEIAGAVVSALKVRLAPGQRTPTAPRTSNPEAYNQVLIGKQFFDREDLEGYRHAQDAFRKAIALDPKYGAAYAGLAASLFWISDFTGDEAALKESLTTADKAVAIAPEEANGYSTRGYLRFRVGWDWSSAQIDLEKALDLDPGADLIQSAYGELLGTLGRFPEAFTPLRKSTALNPLSVSNWATLGYYLLEDRQFVAARDALNHALQIEPDSPIPLFFMGQLQLQERDAVSALATFGRIAGDGAYTRALGTAIAEHSLGHPRESQAALDELIRVGSKIAAYQIAEAYAWRGEKDSAFEWLERSYRQRDDGMTDLRGDLLLASLHGDPRFDALMQKMKFSH